MKSILAEVLSQTQKEYGCTPIAFTTKIVFYCMIRKKDLNKLMGELMIEPSSKVNTKLAFTYHSDFGDIRFIVTKSVKEPIVSTRLHYEKKIVEQNESLLKYNPPSWYNKEQHELIKKHLDNKEHLFINTSPKCKHGNWINSCGQCLEECKCDHQYKVFSEKGKFVSRCVKCNKLKSE